MFAVRIVIASAALLALAACSGTGTGTGTGSGSQSGGKTATIKSAPAPVTAPPAAPARPAVRPPVMARPAARVMTAPGLAGIIGADSDTLVRLFGPPRLDIREDDARKLQWSGTACILDVYLYPGPTGGQQTATYVDARRGDGRDVDRAACIAALRRQP